MAEIVAMPLYNARCLKCGWFYRDGFLTIGEAIDYGVVWHTDADCAARLAEQQPSARDNAALDNWLSDLKAAPVASESDQ